jgi:phage gpG-like protein
MIDFEIQSDFDEVSSYLKIEKFGNFRTVLRRWQKYLEEEQRKRFRMLAHGGTYDEISWPYFHPNTIKYGFRRVKGKVKDGDAIMRDSNDLYNSFRGAEFNLTNNSIEFRIMDPFYAAIHQEGAPSKNLPARPVFHISDRNIKYLMDLIKNGVRNKRKTSGKS